MLHHHRSHPADPARAVLLGAGGFVGRALAGRLADDGVAVLAPARADLDLAADGAGERLAALLRPDDAVVLLAAITPDKGRGTTPFMTNLRMAEHVALALRARPVCHLVYVGSDAVYPLAAEDAAAAVDERTPAAPTDLYGAMHRSRELMLGGLDVPLAVLRPTMVYGPGDTHGAYGPNRFRRSAAAEGRIVLFGDGEETRDHLALDDVVDLMVRVLRHRSAGLLNLASGRSVSYRTLAAMVAALSDRPVAITGVPRQVPVTHRRFDVAAIGRAFPDFAPTPLETGLRRAHAALLAGSP